MDSPSCWFQSEFLRDAYISVCRDCNELPTRESFEWFTRMITSQSTPTCLSMRSVRLGLSSIIAVTKYLDCNPKLKTLDLYDNILHDVGLMVVIQLVRSYQKNNENLEDFTPSAFKGLTRINVGGNDLGNESALALAEEFANPLSKLEAVELGIPGQLAYPYFKPASNSSVIAISKLSGIDTTSIASGNNSNGLLHLHQNRLDAGSVLQICSSLKNNRSLKYLGLSGNYIGLNTQLGQAYTATECNNIINECLSTISEMLSQNKVLTGLDLSYNALGDAGIAAIVSGFTSNKSLKKISFAGNGLTFASCPTIATALSSEGIALEEIDFSHNIIGNGSGILMQGLKKCKSLQKLKMVNCALNNEGVICLSRILSGKQQIIEEILYKHAEQKRLLLEEKISKQNARKTMTQIELAKLDAEEKEEKKNKKSKNTQKKLPASNENILKITYKNQVVGVISRPASRINDNKQKNDSMSERPKSGLSTYLLNQNENLNNNLMKLTETDEDISNSSFSTDDPTQVSKLEYYPVPANQIIKNRFSIPLKYLNLQQNGITKEGFRELADYILTNPPLNTLILSGNYINPQSGIELANAILGKQIDIEKVVEYYKEQYEQKKGVKLQILQNGSLSVVQNSIYKNTNSNENSPKDALSSTFLPSFLQNKPRSFISTPNSASAIDYARIMRDYSKDKNITERSQHLSAVDSDERILACSSRIGNRSRAGSRLNNRSALSNTNMSISIQNHNETNNYPKDILDKDISNYDNKLEGFNDSWGSYSFGSFSGNFNSNSNSRSGSVTGDFKNNEYTRKIAVHETAMAAAKQTKKHARRYRSGRISGNPINIKKHKTPATSSGIGLGTSPDPDETGNTKIKTNISMAGILDIHESSARNIDIAPPQAAMQINFNSTMSTIRCLYLDSCQLTDIASIAIFFACSLLPIKVISLSDNYISSIGGEIIASIAANATNGGSIIKLNINGNQLLYSAVNRIQKTVMKNIQDINEGTTTQLKEHIKTFSKAIEKFDLVFDELQQIKNDSERIDSLKRACISKIESTKVAHTKALKSIEARIEQQLQSTEKSKKQIQEVNENIAKLTKYYDSELLKADELLKYEASELKRVEERDEKINTINENLESIMEEQVKVLEWEKSKLEAQKRICADITKKAQDLINQYGAKNNKYAEFMKLALTNKNIDKMCLAAQLEKCVEVLDRLKLLQTKGQILKFI